MASQPTQRHVMLATTAVVVQLQQLQLMVSPETIALRVLTVQLDQPLLSCVLLALLVIKQEI